MCSSDLDYYELVIPEGSCYSLVIDVFADDTPGYWPYGKGLDPKVYLKDDECHNIASNNNGGEGHDSHLESECLDPGTYYIKVKGQSSTGPYLLAVHCTPCDDCCPETHDYAAEPIYTGPGIWDPINEKIHYENTANTCCATSPVECVPHNECSGNCRNSGPSIIYMIILESTGTLDITASGDANIQLMVFRDTSDPAGTCVASSDGGGNSETLHLTLAADTYYISTSYRASVSDNHCEITLVIDSDTHLPVELSTFEAIAGNREVVLNWTTASEQNNAYFEIQRSTRSDGWITIAQVDGSGNSQTALDYTYTDRTVVNGIRYTYRLLSHDINGAAHEYETTSEATPDAPMPTEYALEQNFPNPFNPNTTISYALKEAGFATLKIYNLLGQEVANLVSQQMEIGRYSVTFNAYDLPSGIYIYRLEVNDFTDAKKMMLMK